MENNKINTNELVIIDGLYYLWIKDLKEVLHIGNNKTYKMVVNGKIPVFKIEVIWRFKASDLIDYLDEKTHQVELCLLQTYNSRIIDFKML